MISCVWVFPSVVCLWDRWIGVFFGDWGYGLGWVQQAFGYSGHTHMLCGASLGLCMCINILDDEYGSGG